MRPPCPHLRTLPAIALVLAIAVGGCSSNDPAPPAPSNLPYFQRLTGTPVAETSPALSPDGARVVYERSDEIWVLVIANRAAARVAPRGNHPSWSPDGQSVLFVRRDIDGGGPLHRLVRLQLASGALDTLSADTVDVYEPQAAPVGDAVAMRILSRVNTLQNLRVVAGDGSDQATLTPAGPWVDSSPAWSADGTWIAFVRLAQDGVPRLYRVPSEGEVDASVVGVGTNGAAGPTWHPDGRIVFSRNGELSWVSASGGPDGARRRGGLRRRSHHLGRWPADGLRLGPLRQFRAVAARRSRGDRDLDLPSLGTCVRPPCAPPSRPRPR